MLNLQLISEAAHALEGIVRRTPVEESPVLSDILGVPVWLKLENLQITGSFKARGAYFALLQAKKREVTDVATCSAGNHGKGVAWAAHLLGMKATIFVPSSVDSSKYTGMVRYGATVVKSKFPGYDETEAWAKSECSRLELPFISAFDDYDVMAANGGTVGKEILEDVPDVHHIVLPVGGGGLSSGVACYVKSARPSCRIELTQHKDSPAFKRSMDRGEAVLAMPAIETLAGGLEGGIGQKTFDVLRHHYDSVSLVSEEALTRAMIWMIEHHQWVIEGSSAVALAAGLEAQIPRPTGPVVLVISGRNVAASVIRNVLDESRA